MKKKSALARLVVSFSRISRGANAFRCRAMVIGRGETEGGVNFALDVSRMTPMLFLIVYVYMCTHRYVCMSVYIHVCIYKTHTRNTLV